MKAMRRLWGWLRCGFDFHNGSVTFLQSERSGRWISWFQYTTCLRCGKVMDQVYR